MRHQLLSRTSQLHVLHLLACAAPTCSMRSSNQLVRRGGYAEQHMTVRFGESLSTVSSSGNFELSGGVDDPVPTRGISSLQKRPAEVAGDQSK